MRGNKLPREKPTLAFRMLITSTKKITGQNTPESQIGIDRVKEGTIAIYIPEEEANELKDILYILNETKRLFAGSDIKWLASELRGKTDGVNKILLLIKHLPTFSSPKTV
ncbi:hypothetical protein AVEN_209451-1 [Araneus ventricosus]|uniref:Uncharacterized protein n=1 Tax=Araneus ventricosus TaxID=182803 RepID=A0A4Y2M4P8_ARAVE|nr:hypothetical protein AVEN_209451-1 [Araneus ventricosus]